jgi:Protein of unknown function (DUF3732)
MRFEIREIILWPRRQEFEPRRLKFQSGKVNIISGNSRTGKSAVIPIIDYCLAANSCAIPTETIRKACSWFGVIVKTPNGEKLFAREEPGEHRVTDAMYVAEGTEVAVPRVMEKNTGADRVRQMLNELSGLSNLDFDPDAGAFPGFDAKVSFRDLAAFNFQPQNVIANPEVLFFKTNTYEHREKLRKIFPYILGAITPAMLGQEHELNRLRQELRRKERELKEAHEVSHRWMASLQARISEGRELGLITDSLPQNASREEMVSALEAVVRRTDAAVAITSDTISGAVQEISGLENEEKTVSLNLGELRQRLTEMSRVREGASSYSGALQVQHKRLKIAEWLQDQTAEGVSCVLCGSDHEPAAAQLAELIESMHQIESTIGDFGQIPAAFDREFQRVQADLSESAEKLKSIRSRRQALSRRSEEAEKIQFAARQADRFIGSTENALELYRKLGGDQELEAEVARLRDSIQALQAAVRGSEIEARKKRALSIVNANAERLLPTLDVENAKSPISLEINDLTVKVIRPDREDYLNEIGSGSNWLSYHIAIMLGLHEFFLTLPSSPVPGFLVIDQPSQVYFPRKLATRSDEELVEQDLADDDVDAVRSILGTLGAVVGRAQGQLQVIVLDHAPSSVWGNLPNVVEVEEWRDGKTKLVPLQWLAD